ncbi:dihydrofolate reductase family protein [uncultured Tateyamaria sp.]|uniref:dihydrofolate reductase family protein n=1 Tax=Tateyamaria sp. 1078 TaxID=3417464 RepID=UPI00260AE8CC|nr:dihydrofolate reductase family protein [uncultured Tateyamaria sp.]
MRRLAVLAFVTLDGVMQSPSAAEEDPSGGFDRGGWAVPYWDGVMPHVEQTAMAAPYDILFGRKTYDIFAAHWPNAPRSTAADRLSGARKYVVTGSPETLHWDNSEAVHGDAVAAIRALKQTDGPLLQVHGSATLIQTLQAYDLIDDFRLWTFPVVVGAGKRLFGPDCTPRAYALRRAQALVNGVMQQEFVRA